ncbi:MarR family transcriptional regulator [Staphylococcus chromogenes]|uniref:MarR family transcriptional regulator n=1 Tax=Staphylococcus chromogenes TaxID=46126 RepID=A0AAE5W9A6_STACR|nr:MULTISPECIES: MarR family transcriptional regulator [Staphylococcus]KDP12558.1 MarR family transcriptional regulator [Staphylococcus chromogenes MU 970]MBP0046319.1 MarR family transcriptional regulator [Staphylococcus chromogenes]MBV5137804.1 MarR family transcriptional regulator [Staphylococcus chromogenes]MBV5191498.1 MarR family transcriptional regulator [Staphylococcus chromogenes]MBW3131846.1 MarR family transcriptional regulator [Staphylococcus chromogenes]
MNRVDTSLKVFIGLRRTNDMLDKLIHKDIKSYGLNVTEFAVLEVLYNRGEHTIQRIKERILIASSSTTYVVTNLEKKGYIQRRQDTKDKRVSYASLTDKGRAFMDEIFPNHANAIASVFSDLSEDELQSLQKVLKRISTQSE